MSIIIIIRITTPTPQIHTVSPISRMRRIRIEKRHHCFLFLFLFLFPFNPLLLLLQLLTPLLLLLPFLSFLALDVLTSRRRRRRSGNRRRSKRRRSKRRRNHRQPQFLPLRTYKRGYNRRNWNRNGSSGRSKCRRSSSTTGTITSTTRRQRICRVVCGQRGRRVGQVGRVRVGVKRCAVVVNVAVVGRGGETRTDGSVLGVMGRIVVVPPGLMCCCCGG